MSDTKQDFRLWEWIGQFRPIPDSRPGDFIGAGWVKIVERLAKHLSAPEYECKITCVKEKFGGLRVYTEPKPEMASEVWALCNFAEDISYMTCEKCGNPGELRSVKTWPCGGWLKTLCSKCADELAQIGIDAPVHARLF